MEGHEKPRPKLGKKVKTLTTQKGRRRDKKDWGNYTEIK